MTISSPPTMEFEFPTNNVNSIWRFLQSAIGSVWIELIVAENLKLKTEN